MAIPPYTEAEDFSASMYKHLFDRIYQDFIKVSEKLIDKFFARSIAISRDEFLLYLKIIHYFALAIIQKHYTRQGFARKIISQSISNTQILDSSIQTIDVIEESALKQNKSDLEAIFNFTRTLKYSSHWTMIRNTNQSFANQDFIFFECVDFYMQSLEKLLYPESYVACFMEEATNSSAWGHYRDRHRGICLIFGSFETWEAVFETIRKEIW
ncbi:hypothetical protein [Helicobacter sp. MIT 05-5294]|uniref:hypothetical protein n=1 Tax=Helicobacter sp. MIT 05-5294 TaxID=1548150 RepID=UPI0010FDE9AA|nr:hypothetical protein [Helicobacter sp. MIT 05-5294]TLD87246.1 hypothetical protein LS69_004305 [Helicobacter sp. MIT 05-5294]